MLVNLFQNLIPQLAALYARQTPSLNNASTANIGNLIGNSTPLQFPPMQETLTPESTTNFPTVASSTSPSTNTIAGALSDPKAVTAAIQQAASNAATPVTATTNGKVSPVEEFINSLAGIKVPVTKKPNVSISSRAPTAGYPSGNPLASIMQELLRAQSGISSVPTLGSLLGRA